ncbi:MAG TPA: glycosyl transferase, partial [Pseudomonas sp.]|nr:glycosyl transferase [Pseudomonas sp.]
MRTALIIPTRNASSHLARLLPALQMQSLQPDEMLVVDSASSDDTVARFREFGARVEVIDARDFNHGGTRRWASEQVEGEALIVMTQDAIPAAPDTFANLLDELQQDPLNGVAYGRQLPHPGAGVLGAQSRHFNYPDQSRSKSLADAPELGIKTCFSSDSFSVYRRSALQAVGGFPA